jgi:hypothetical protein
MNPTSTHVEEAIRSSGLRVTYTPCVLMLRKPPPEALSKIGNLPDAERQKSFRLLISILGVADSERRAGCGDNCAHWWNRDLRDEAVVRQILAEGAA